MKVCDLTLSSPEENLACDEALLEWCEQENACQVLRFWTPERHFVVVGYANRVAREVNLEFCQARRIPVLRRCTGGGTVLQGPGCLNYSLLLRISETGPTRNITSTNEFVMGTHATLLSSLLSKSVSACGHTDLAIDGLKFSGNAQRRRKHYLLFHGCFLLSMDIALIAASLQMPSKEPAYRLNRAHADFLTNIPFAEAELKAALARGWGASEPLSAVPNELISKLVGEKYSRRDWNFKF